MKISFLLLTLILSGCAHTSHLVNSSNISKSSKLITESKCFFPYCWQAEIAKVYDLKGGVVVEEGFFTWKDVTIPSMEVEVIVRCFKDNIFGYRSYFLKADPGIQYELGCEKDRLNNNAKAVLVKKSTI